MFVGIDHTTLLPLAKYEGKAGNNVFIAVTVLAAAVVGAVVWWLRRGTGEGAADDRFEVDRSWGLLPPDVEAAFVEGLRAYHDSGSALRVHEELEVLVAYDPPRSISLRLLADAFAARGDAALHDPQGTVTELMAELATAERPGVLHLRGEWPPAEPEGVRGPKVADGPEIADGMDAERFATAVAETVTELVRGPAGAAASAAVADAAAEAVVTDTAAEAAVTGTAAEHAHAGPRLRARPLSGGARAASGRAGRGGFARGRHGPDRRRRPRRDVGPPADPGPAPPGPGRPTRAPLIAPHPARACGGLIRTPRAPGTAASRVPRATASRVPCRASRVPRVATAPRPGLDRASLTAPAQRSCGRRPRQLLQRPRGATRSSPPRGESWGGMAAWGRAVGGGARPCCIGRPALGSAEVAGGVARADSAGRQVRDSLTGAQGASRGWGRGEASSRRGR
ncbi:hypothetical protein GCM10027203_63370 [Nonomuraea fastidiosa]